MDIYLIKVEVHDEASLSSTYLFLMRANNNDAALDKWRRLAGYSSDGGHEYWRRQKVSDVDVRYVPSRAFSGHSVSEICFDEVILHESILDEYKPTLVIEGRDAYDNPLIGKTGRGDMEGTTPFASMQMMGKRYVVIEESLYDLILDALKILEG